VDVDRPFSRRIHRLCRSRAHRRRDRGIKREFDLSDTHLGLLGGAAFVLLRMLLLVPLGRLADVWNRKSLVVISMTVISAATVLFGAAKSVATLIVARLAVGGASAGTTPPSVSMIADLFPVRVRGFAMGIWNAAGAIGAAAGFTIAGWITYHYGWRPMMISFGSIGLIIALLNFLTVREPERRDSAGHVLDGEDVPSVGEAFRFMFRQKSLLHISIGFGLVYGLDITAWTWEAAFLQRSFGIDVAQASANLGVAWFVGGLPGTLLGGYLLDVGGRHDLRWHCWLVAIASTSCILPALVIFLSPNLTLVIVAIYIQSFAVATTYAAMTMVSIGLFGARMKTIGYGAFSIFLYSGYAWGPSLVGFMSTNLEDTFGVHSLRYALLSANVLFLWATFHFLRAARTIREDYANADRNG
jgi:MFS family permease